jgi:hypothetical protein
MLLCDMGAGTMRPVTGKNSLEETYKGCRHKLSKYIQETQHLQNSVEFCSPSRKPRRDSESGMEIDSFV